MYLKQYRIVAVQKSMKISDRFNEEFGLAEPVEDTSLRSKNEDWCWFFDPYYKAKARVSIFVVAGSLILFIKLRVGSVYLLLLGL